MYGNCGWKSASVSDWLVTSLPVACAHETSKSWELWDLVHKFAVGLVRETNLSQWENEQFQGKGSLWLFSFSPWMSFNYSACHQLHKKMGHKQLDPMEIVSNVWCSFDVSCVMLFWCLMCVLLLSYMWCHFEIAHVWWSLVSYVWCSFVWYSFDVFCVMLF